MHRHARFWFFALLFCLLAARAAGAAETAGPKPADLWTGDWLTVCDNTGSCRTAGYNADGAERLITLSFYREAGAQAKVAGLWFAIYRGSDEPLPEGGSLRIDGKPLTRNEILTPQEIAALLEALKRGSSITWAAEGGPVWQLSSNGALAALRFMDDYQQRSGTPSALIDKGRSRRPVRAPAAVPKIQAAAATAREQRRVLAHSDPQFAALREMLEKKENANKWRLDGCDVFSHDEWRTITLEPLTSNLTLAEIPCAHTGFNSHNAYAVLTRDLNHVVDVIDSHITNDYGLDEQGVLTITGYWKETAPGDGQSWETWVWTGRRFVLASKSNSGMARGFDGFAGIPPLEFTQHTSQVLPPKKKRRSGKP